MCVPAVDTWLNLRDILSIAVESTGQTELSSYPITSSNAFLRDRRKDMQPGFVLPIKREEEEKKAPIKGGLCVLITLCSHTPATCFTNDMGSEHSADPSIS
jgi:hypothetical protein